MHLSRYSKPRRRHGDLSAQQLAFSESRRPASRGSLRCVVRGAAPRFPARLVRRHVARYTDYDQAARVCLKHRPCHAAAAVGILHGGLRCAHDAVSWARTAFLRHGAPRTCRGAPQLTCAELLAAQSRQFRFDCSARDAGTLDVALCDLVAYASYSRCAGAGSKHTARCKWTDGLLRRCSGIVETGQAASRRVVPNWTPFTIERPYPYLGLHRPKNKTLSQLFAYPSAPPRARVRALRRGAPLPRRRHE